MPKDKEIEQLSASAFADHRMTKGPGLSWRLGQDNTSYYSFRVTWTPGVVIVTGDIGTAIYNVWPSFNNLWDAVDLIKNASFDYLAGKSGEKLEFDQDATIRNILTQADHEIRQSEKGEDCQIWKALFDWCYDPYTDNHRNATQQMKVAKWLREEANICPEQIAINLGDIDDWWELYRSRYPAQSHWCYQAVKLWAGKMEDQKPLTVKMHRRWKTIKREIRSYRDCPVVYRPQFFWHDPAGPNRHFSTGKRPHIYTKVKRKGRDGSPFTWHAEIGPWKLLNKNMGKYGFYRCTGSGGGDGSDMIPYPHNATPTF
jgi:hypothetical protein